MKELKQNNLVGGTTELGFLDVMNDNAVELGTTARATLQREVTLDTGETVIVESMTPNAIKNLLNQQILAAESQATEVTFKTPGENIGELDGVCQLYNTVAEPVTMTISTLSGATPDLLGKTPADLQTVALSGLKVTGTLNYVTGYTGFSGDPALQQGNYLAIKVESDNAETITCEIYPSASGTQREITLDADGIFVGRIANNAQVIKVRVKNDARVTLKTLDLSELVLTPAPAALDTIRVGGTYTVTFKDTFDIPNIDKTEAEMTTAEFNQLKADIQALVSINRDGSTEDGDSIFMPDSAGEISIMTGYKQNDVYHFYTYLPKYQCTGEQTPGWYIYDAEEEVITTKINHPEAITFVVGDLQTLEPEAFYGTIPANIASKYIASSQEVSAPVEPTVATGGTYDITFKDTFNIPNIDKTEAQMSAQEKSDLKSALMGLPCINGGDSGNNAFISNDGSDVNIVAMILSGSTITAAYRFLPTYQCTGSQTMGWYEYDVEEETIGAKLTNSLTIRYEVDALSDINGSLSTISAEQKAKYINYVQLVIAPIV